MEIPAVIREKAPLMELSELERYVQKVHKLLAGMKPGNVLELNKICKLQTRDLFIETAKYYMDIHKETYQDGLGFTRGFAAVQKYDVQFLMGKKTGSTN